MSPGGGLPRFRNSENVKMKPPPSYALGRGVSNQKVNLIERHCVIKCGKTEALWLQNPGQGNSAGRAQSSVETFFDGSGA
jgi:hypothetical protein